MLQTRKSGDRVTLKNAMYSVAFLFLLLLTVAHASPMTRFFKKELSDSNPDLILKAKGKHYPKVAISIDVAQKHSRLLASFLECHPKEKSLKVNVDGTALHQVILILFDNNRLFKVLLNQTVTWIGLILMTWQKV
jgi:hypothetical protein